MTVNKSFTGALRKGDQPGQVRGRYALVVPAGLSKKNGARLKTELAEQGGTVLGVDDCGLLLVRWDADTRVALFGLKDVTAAYPDRIRSSVLRKMPKKAARLGRLWNWSIKTRDRPVRDKEVKRLLKKLGLRVRGKEVEDRLGKQSLGRVTEDETTETQGNWCLVHRRSWRIIPGFFGYWERLRCSTTTYRDYPACSGTRWTMDVIEAEVSGTHHYAHSARTDRSGTSVEDWAYVWVGEHHCRGFTSHAVRDGRSAGWGYYGCD